MPWKYRCMTSSQIVSRRCASHGIMTTAKRNEAVVARGLFAPTGGRHGMHPNKTCRSVALILILTPGVHAQPERYELGQRLRAFENAWGKQADADARKRAV